MKNKSLVLLSGEESPIPGAEAKALFLAYDPLSTFRAPERRIMLADSAADPFVVGSRAAFSRRVGVLLSDPREANEYVRGKRVRVRSFDLRQQRPLEPGRVLSGVQVEVDLSRPDYELTVVRGEEDYIALTAPLKMRQGWSLRRPRRRAFFHPSAMFPKLSRALVNLSRVREGGVLLDPFAGTGSIPIEASIIGARAVAVDQASRMTLGSLANMRGFRQEWLGVVRADCFMLPLTRADAVVTDVPYGRASTTYGVDRERVLDQALSESARVLRLGSRAVIMHAKDGGAMSSRAFATEEEHDLYVHKLLTRTISILRRR